MLHPVAAALAPGHLDGENMSVRLPVRGRPGMVPITPLTAGDLKGWLGRQPRTLARWVTGTGFDAAPGSVCLLPGDGGALAGVLAGMGGSGDVWSYAGLPEKLPAQPPGGGYRLDASLPPAAANRAVLGWVLGTYAFTKYRKPTRTFADLAWPAGVDQAAVRRAAEATFLVRDLINTPAADMGPAELAAAARRLARAHKARFSVIIGDALLAKNYPAIHAVGRASARAPRLIDLRWGNRGPRISLVGKGVCFDSGGLDLKSAAGMLLMKKDMGGGAHVLGLAAMVMAAKLPVRLRVLVPAVENSVSGNAMRPMDVLRTRKGLTVEVGNTDAEGRLVLCDALAEADREKPDLLIDIATLTGAARVALGPDLPALFCNDDKLADRFLAHAKAEDDPLWRMPLHAPYRRLLDSKVADINNVSDGPYAGAITAALYLAEFVDPKTPWAHIDVMAWNVSAKPGRPVGGDAMGLRAAYALIEAMARPR